MNMRKEIQNAFDKVHAPDELVERMKQDLYQKDLHEDVEEYTFQVTEAPRRHIWRYMAYIAAALALCIGCGVSVMNMRDNPFNPASNVVTTTEDTTETTDAASRDYAAFQSKQQEKEIMQSEQMKLDQEKQQRDYQKQQKELASAENEIAFRERQIYQQS